MSADLYKDNDMISTPVSVSIIIPVFNVELYIKDCLNSVIAQNYTGPMECIIVDDCGTDNSMEIVSRYVNNYCGPIIFKIIHHETNKGLSAARNTGINNANGNYIFFLDSDDELYPNAISSLASPLSKCKYDLVIACYDTEGSDSKMPPLLLKTGEMSQKDIFCTYLKGEWYMMAWNKLYRRQFLLDNSLLFMDGLLHEDELWSFQIAALAESMYVTKDVCYVYKIRPGSITTVRKEEIRIKALQRIYHELVVFVNKQHKIIIPEVWEFLQIWFLRILIEVYKTKTTIKFEDTYKTLRYDRLPYKFKFSSVGKTVKNIMRDLHFLLPIPISIVYEKLLISLLSKKWVSPR